MAERKIKSRIIHKHDVASNWKLATNFTPEQGEIIIYDIDSNYDYERIKIGDGVQNVNSLPFINEKFDIDSSRVLHNNEALSSIIDMYIFNIDYDALLSFDTSEIVFDNATTSVLGQAILGQIVLA